MRKTVDENAPTGKNGLLTPLLETNAPASVLFIRLMIGGVFLSEGIQKWLFPKTFGVGRFLKIGIPAAEIVAPLVGSVEMLCGFLLLLGLFTRLGSIPLIIIMLVALRTTKFPILQQNGFWAMAHEARTDFCMLLGSVFLLLVGGGRLSLDYKWGKRLPPHE